MAIAMTELSVIILLMIAERVGDLIHTLKGVFGL